MLALLSSAPSHGEVSVDWLYDFRHATDPRDNPNDFPVVEFKAFIPQSFGSFLMKEEIDLDGTNHNVSQVYSEVSQSVRLGQWAFQDRPLFVHLGYSGGLGLSGGATSGFYIQNAYIVGLEYPFELHKAFCNVYVALRDTNFARPYYGPMFAAYVGRKFLNDKLLLANSLEGWTTPVDQRPTSGQPQHATLTSWELESEAWYSIARNFSLGTYIRTTRNVYSASNRWMVYPSAGIRFSF
jgi:hypothetical protein